MSVRDTRTEWFETITLSLYCTPGHAPSDDVTAEAWERAENHAATAFAEHGADVRVEQGR